MITTKQIKTLRQEFGAVGDWVSLAICDVALATRLGQIAEIDDSVRADLEIMGIIPEHLGSDVVARAKLAEMIAEVEADRWYEESLP